MVRYPSIETEQCGILGRTLVCTCIPYQSIFLIQQYCRYHTFDTSTSTAVLAFRFLRAVLIMISNIPAGHTWHQHFDHTSATVVISKTCRCDTITSNTVHHASYIPRARYDASAHLLSSARIILAPCIICVRLCISQKEYNRRGGSRNCPLLTLRVQCF